MNRKLSSVCVCVLKTEYRTPKGKLLRLASRQESSVLESPHGTNLESDGVWDPDYPDRTDVNYER